MTTIAVIAGTPTDTALGAAMARSHGFDVLSAPAAQLPQEQGDLQAHNPAELQRRTANLIAQLAGQGAEAALIHCNSLSAAIDVEAVRAGSPIPVVTPFDAHRLIAAEWRHVGLWAVTGQSLAGLETVYYAVNFDEENGPSRVVGADMVRVVMAVEEHEPPEQIAANYGLVELTAAMAAMGAECIVLGCTHLPYFAAALAPKISLPIVNPDDIMIDLIRQALA
jgi:glutamate racemase